MSGDFSAAFAEWEPLAHEGLAAAQLNLGLLYSTGHGLPKDLERPRCIGMNRPPTAVYPRRKQILRIFMSMDLAVEADPTKAARMYRRAAEQGLPVAQYNIGRSPPRRSP